jgi:hypothetical protein
VVRSLDPARADHQPVIHTKGSQNPDVMKGDIGDLNGDMGMSGASDGLRR